MKKLVVGALLTTALLVPAAGAQATEPLPDDSCRVCVTKCGYGYLVYWYDLDGRQEVLLNACIYH